MKVISLMHFDEDVIIYPLLRAGLNSSFLKWYVFVDKLKKFIFERWPHFAYICLLLNRIPVYMVYILHKFVFIQMFEVSIFDVNMLVRAAFRLLSYDICKMVVTNTDWDEPRSIVIIIIGNIHMIYKCTCIFGNKGIFLYKLIETNYSWFSSFYHLYVDQH
jgi:hypothetical protein